MASLEVLLRETASPEFKAKRERAFALVNDFRRLVEARLDLAPVYLAKWEDERAVDEVDRIEAEARRFAFDFKELLKPNG